MTDDANTKPVELSWPQAADCLFVSGVDSENNVWLKWRGDEKWIAYAEGYKKAADILVERVTAREAEAEQDFLGYPIGFLYRHYLELILKSLIVTGSQALRKAHGNLLHHDIKRLWQEARPILEQVWPNGPKVDLDNVEQCMREFDAIDPHPAEAFRYPLATDGRENLPDLTHINLRNLREVMDRLAGLLDAAYYGMLEILSIRREAEDYLSY